MTIMIKFDQNICRDVESASQREWLETNGLGGFASSTITGLNTRRYHGLLVAATEPPVGRLVMLSKLEETLVLDGQRYELSTNQYPGAIHPRGYQYLTEFRLDPFPVQVFEVDGVVIQKTVFMLHGENTTIIQYSVAKHDSELPDGTVLEVRPLIPCRDYHSTGHENGVIDSGFETAEGLTTICPYPGNPTLWFAHSTAQVEATGHWYRNLQYQSERDRGLDFNEDIFNPFNLKFDLLRQSQPAIHVSTEPRHTQNIGDTAGLRQDEVERRARLRGSLRTEEQFVQDLVAAADQFIVKRGDDKTIIAGYHWFSDWGRDTMISLPGLTLATGRDDVARSILLAFAKVVDRGMLPNRFPDAGEQPEYNTVDATLWYFEAVRALVQRTGDSQFVRDNLYQVLGEIIDWHVCGTRYNIRVDSDGLLNSGEPGVQLTWMDAKVGDWVVTPRIGKPVEIQALWYNALMVMKELAAGFDDRAGERRYGRMAGQAKKSFNRLFWNEATDCLYDVIDGQTFDQSIRPNQVLAISLTHSMLSRERAKRIMAVVQRDLLTPYGLRTLAPGDRHYHGRYAGSPLERDGAYHQGTVWPWLIGPFITAYLKTSGRNKRSLRQAEQWLKTFESHLTEAGLGQISEVFDGDPPHLAGGCIAQAWSVAELLRVAIEDVYSD